MFILDRVFASNFSMFKILYLLTSNFSSNKSAVIICFAPKAFAFAMQNNPTGPQPIIRMSCTIDLLVEIYSVQFPGKIAEKR